MKDVNTGTKDEEKGANSTVNLFEDPSTSKSEVFGLICETENYEYCNDFSTHLQLYSKIVPTRFNSDKDIVDAINRGMTFSYILTIKQKGDTIDFDIRSSSVTYQSVYESANELYIKSNIDKEQTRRFKTVQQIIANFIKSKSTSTPPTHTLSIEEMTLTRPKIYNLNNCKLHFNVLKCHYLVKKAVEI